MNVTTTRFHLRLAALFCVVAGLQAGNAFAAVNAGGTPFWGAAGAVASLLAAYFTIRDGIARAGDPSARRIS